MNAATQECRNKSCAARPIHLISDHYPEVQAVILRAEPIRRDKLGNAIGGPATGAQRSAQERMRVQAEWDAMDAADYRDPVRGLTDAEWENVKLRIDAISGRTYYN